MSTLKIREYQRLADVYPGGSAPIAQEPGLDQTAVTFTATHGESAAFSASTKYIGIKADAAFCYVVSKAGTAATTNAIDQAAGEVLYLGVSPGHIISVVAA
jgi:hypothetical protein